MTRLPFSTDGNHSLQEKKILSCEIFFGHIFASQQVKGYGHSLQIAGYTTDIHVNELQIYLTHSNIFEIYIYDVDCFRVGSLYCIVLR